MIVGLRMSASKTCNHMFLPILQGAKSTQTPTSQPRAPAENLFKYFSFDSNTLQPNQNDLTRFPPHSSTLSLWTQGCLAGLHDAGMRIN